MNNSNWKFYEELNFEDLNINCYNIDTRDFYGSESSSEINIENFDYVKNNKKRFVYTIEEVLSNIERLFVESGGKGSWRMLDLVTNDKRCLNWKLKYLRIYRTEVGFCICNNQNQAIPKHIICLPVEKELLNHH